MTKEKHKKTAATLAVTLMKSRTGRLPAHAATLKGLGLRRIRQTVILKDTPSIRGMIEQVSYLLKVEQGS